MPLPNNPNPKYPATAVRQRRHGTVLLALELDANGQVVSLSIHRSSGHDDLDRAAVAAARKWRFEPAYRGEQAVPIRILKPFRFLLERR